jgi:hypothetical protein
VNTAAAPNHNREGTAIVAENTISRCTAARKRWAAVRAELAAARERGENTAELERAEWEARRDFAKAGARMADDHAYADRLAHKVYCQS